MYIHTYIRVCMLKMEVVLLYTLICDVFRQCLICQPLLTCLIFFLYLKEKLLKDFPIWCGKLYSLSESYLSWLFMHLTQSFFQIDIPCCSFIWVPFFFPQMIGQFGEKTGDDLMKGIWYVVCSLGIWESSKPTYKGEILLLLLLKSRWKESSITGLVVAVILWFSSSIWWFRILQCSSKYVFTLGWDSSPLPAGRTNRPTGD